jgi:translation elongation factor EF-G
LTKGEFPMLVSISLLLLMPSLLRSFLLNMTAFPEMIRNVAVVGHLHHGKTALMDMLVFETHKLMWDSDTPVGSSKVDRLTCSTTSQTRYTDTHVLSRQREISIKASAMSLVLSTSSGKSNLIHFIDTPGHVNFVDEVASAMVLVVDVVEGVSHLQGSSHSQLNACLGHGQHGAHYTACSTGRLKDYTRRQQN